MSSVLVTPGQLIDALITTNIKLSIQLEKAYDKNATDEKIGQAKKRICQLNAKRVKLIEEIDADFLKWLDGERYLFFPANKDYGKSDMTKDEKSEAKKS